MQLNLKQVSHYHGKRPILTNLSLSLNSGEIGALIGPSGAGKTTVLNCISGLEHVTDGEIHVDGKLVSSKTTHIPAEKRQIGLMFQDAALFPHLSVADNVGFALKESNGTKKDRVAELIELCRLEGLEDTRPHELSGGQQKRVALARALAPHPRLLLLDEPFSGTDAALRDDLLQEICSVLRKEKATALMVTHDQNEAFAMADRCGVIDAGNICQWDSAYNLYHRPNCAFVANFIGDGVLLDAKLVSNDEVQFELGKIKSQRKLSTPLLQPGRSVKIFLRPDDIVLADQDGTQAKVVGRSFRGADIIYKITTEKGTDLFAVLPSRYDLSVGSAIVVNPQIEHVVVFPSVN